ncbi:hypothetical protein PG994_004241 [Apiospora phragmitis]|uniref:Secreted protein n=1 Tax=Apiospora phragmitis TaxID=2905665 RepID=A0ABR1VR75_9PEZI
MTAHFKIVLSVLRYVPLLLTLDVTPLMALLDDSPSPTTLSVLRHSIDDRLLAGAPLGGTSPDGVPLNEGTLDGSTPGTADSPPLAYALGETPSMKLP